MPFTVSHVAAVLPGRRLPAWAQLPAAPLAAGAMAPDLPMFLTSHSWRAVTHSLGALPLVDPAIALAAALAWAVGLRAVTGALVPGLAARWAPRPRLTRRTAGGLAVRWYLAALVGSTTHLALDLPTHEGPFADRLTVLLTRVGPLQVAGWLQYGLSAVLGLVLLVWAWRWWATTAPRQAVLGDRPQVRRLPLTVVSVLVLAAGAAVGLRQGLAAARGAGPAEHHLWQLQLLSARGAFAGGGAVIAALAVVAAGWWAGRLAGWWAPLPEHAGPVTDCTS